jgi:hypothetical protein
MGLGDYVKRYSGYNAAKSLVNGHPLDAAKQLPGVALASDVANLGVKAAKGIEGAITPGQVDLTGVNQARDNAFGVQDALAAERGGYGGAYSAAKGAMLDTQGQKGIAYLDAAARGAVPSAAELQLQRQASTNAARGFGVASALQGRSPGMALRQALQGQAQIQGQTNADAAALRAQEQAGARGQLVQAVQGQQAVQQGLRGQDINEKGNLLSGQIGALNAGTTAAAEAAKAQAMKVAADDAFKGQLIGAGAGLLARSDETTKTDVHHADLDGLAQALEGFTFEYKDPSAPGAAPGKRVGVMAQDAERGGPAGRAMVRELPDGKKGLDIGNMVGAALAMSAEALKRTRKAA